MRMRLTDLNTCWLDSCSLAKRCAVEVDQNLVYATVDFDGG